ncbi:MAG: hypothetical protein EOM62_16025, partial [Bacteroidia bacterium]|nr:hypothetical protein [Bacteroidia bacterium]
ASGPEELDAVHFFMAYPSNVDCEPASPIGRIRHFIFYVHTPDLSLTLRFAASTISEIYRDRWEIELFFKTLKQNLKVKTFVGESENALRIQIWTALVSLLVIKWLHHLSKAGWSFSNMATMLRLNLFTYRVLRAWLDEPYETPSIVPEAEQLKFSL